MPDCIQNAASVSAAVFSATTYLGKQSACVDRTYPAGELGDDGHATRLFRCSCHASDLQVRYTNNRDSTVPSPAKGKSNRTQGVGRPIKTPRASCYGSWPSAWVCRHFAFSAGVAAWPPQTRATPTRSAFFIAQGQVAPLQPLVMIILRGRPSKDKAGRYLLLGPRIPHCDANGDIATPIVSSWLMKHAGGRCALACITHHTQPRLA